MNCIRFNADSQSMQQKFVSVQVRWYIAITHKRHLLAASTMCCRFRNDAELGNRIDVCAAKQWLLSWSSPYTATVWNPSSAAAVRMRIAISPRLATSNLIEDMVYVGTQRFTRKKLLDELKKEEKRKLERQARNFSLLSKKAVMPTLRAISPCVPEDI